MDSQPGMNPKRIWWASIFHMPWKIFMGALGASILYFYTEPVGGDYVGSLFRLLMEKVWPSMYWTPTECRVIGMVIFAILVGWLFFSALDHAYIGFIRLVIVVLKGFNSGLIKGASLALGSITGAEGAGKSVEFRRAKRVLMDVSIVIVLLTVFIIWEDDLKKNDLYLIAFFVCAGLIYGFGPVLFAKHTSWIREFLHSLHFGKGGSAKLGVLADELNTRFSKGGILFGNSLYYSAKSKSNFKIGIKDNRHMLTVAGTRSGKGRSAIIPNLIEWPHSTIVIDPKGTNAAITAARRGHGGGRVTDCLGQTVHVVDPFGEVKGMKTSCFNPMSAIDIKMGRLVENVRLVTDSMVLPATGPNDFTDGAKEMISGVIASFLLQGWENPPSLIDVRRALTNPKDDVDAMYEEMANMGVDSGLARLARSGASFYHSAEGELSAYLSTVNQNTKWLDGEEMEHVMGHSDFKISDLKNGNTTIYLVVPPDLLDDHKRFLRLFINLAIRSVSQGEISKTPILFLLDEFHSLGNLPLASKAAGLLGEYNYKMWPIVQGLGQLREIYPDNWETFINNSGASQYFAINEKFTLEYIVS